MNNITSHEEKAVSEIDINRFVGNWFEIARIDHWFEKHLEYTTANYSLLPNKKIRIVNCGINKFTKIKKCTKGEAKYSDSSRQGFLKVSFFLYIYSDYLILDIDKENYSYALIGGKSPNYLWILSRIPVLSDEIKDKLIGVAAKKGYNANNLIWIKQNY